MERKRNRMEIMHDMLKIIQGKHIGVKKTHLMYKANLSHNQMKGYLDELIGKDLIENSENKGKISLKITDKGREFFSKYSQIKEFERTFGL